MLKYTANMLWKRSCYYGKENHTDRERIIPIEKESIAEPEKNGKPAPADPEILKKAEAMRNQTAPYAAEN